MWIWQGNDEVSDCGRRLHLPNMKAKLVVRSWHYYSEVEDSTEQDAGKTASSLGRHTKSGVEKWGRYPVNDAYEVIL